MFLEALNILMRTFIKASAALNAMKKYCNMKYKVEKGLKQFYLELSKAASQMVTLKESYGSLCRINSWGETLSTPTPKTHMAP